MSVYSIHIPLAITLLSSNNTSACLIGVIYLYCRDGPPIGGRGRSLVSPSDHWVRLCFLHSSRAVYILWILHISLIPNRSLPPSNDISMLMILTIYIMSMYSIHISLTLLSSSNTSTCLIGVFGFECRDHTGPPIGGRERSLASSSDKSVCVSCTLLRRGTLPLVGTRCSTN